MIDRDSVECSSVCLETAGFRCNTRFCVTTEVVASHHLVAFSLLQLSVEPTLTELTQLHCCITVSDVLKLEQGADPNATNSVGKCCLHFVVGGQAPDLAGIASVLIEAGDTHL